MDLLPFGRIEDEQRRVTISGTGFTSVHVDGFREPYQERLPEIELETHRFKIATLPGIVLLKLIAWQDRPEVRKDNIKDIADILNHFFDMYQKTIWDVHHDLFEDENRNLLDTAAQVMGQVIKGIANRDGKRMKRISALLADSDGHLDKMATIMTEYFGNTVEASLSLLHYPRKGYEEK